MGWSVFRLVRVPWPNTRIIRNNFGYHGLEPELGFGFFGFSFFGFGLGFFGFGLRVLGILPSHTCIYARQDLPSSNPSIQRKQKAALMAFQTEKTSSHASSQLMKTLLPLFQIISHSKNLGESNHFKVWPKFEREIQIFMTSNRYTIKI